MDDLLSLTEAELRRNIVVRKWSTLASWAILLYECVITLNEETRHIWRTPVTAVRSIYMLARYLAIIVQSTNVFLIFGPLSSTDIPEGTCRAWFTFQIIVTCSLMAAMDSILMLRVYALHKKDWKVGFLLGMLFCGQIGVHVICGQRAVNVPYNGVCDSSKTHSAVVYFCISVWVTHISLAVLTIVKHDLMRMKVPVVRIVTRDGAWITVIIISLCTVITPWTLVNQVSKAHMVFGWPISVISISCCRMIMNMQTLNVTASEDRVDLENFTEVTSEIQSLQVDLQGSR